VDGLAIVDFLNGDVDHQGRTHAFILEQGDQWLEDTHDYIQWLFPLDQFSGSRRASPVLDDQAIVQIQQSDKAQQAMKMAASRMRKFWMHNQHWVTRYNHNHLRITRVIKSLRLLVSDQEADQMKKWMVSNLGPNIKAIDPKAVQFWGEA